MKREDLKELHYITPITNVASICELGILSHHAAERIDHGSIAAGEIQERRAPVVVPGGRRLHEYVNLYICARNPMMYLRRGRHRQLCVLRVSPDVLDLPGVVVTPVNASGDYVRWGSGPAGLSLIDAELTFAESWMDSDRIAYYRKKAAKCAEVLVPDVVPPQYLVGAYVSCQEGGDALNEHGTGLAATTDPHLFFR